LDPGEHVGAAPRLGFGPQQRELRRQRGAMVAGEERVDAGDVRVHLSLRLVRHRGPRRARGAPEADGPEEAILRHGGGPEDFGETAESNTTLKLHLPQAILRVRVPEAVERVELGGREDVRDGVGITNDVDRAEMPVTVTAPSICGSERRSEAYATAATT